MKINKLHFLGLLAVILFVNDANAFCDMSVYSSYDMILQRVTDLVSKGKDDAKLISIGYGSELVDGQYREIKALLISKDAANTTGNDVYTSTGKPAVVITGGIHANEWVGVEVAIGVAEYLIENRNSLEPLSLTDTNAKITAYRDVSINRLLENIEIIIVPILNTDGYIYSRGPDGNASDMFDPAYVQNWETLPGWWGEEPPRYKDWRKNRREMPVFLGETNYGVDINRNFPAFWDASNCSHVTDPAHYTSYRGPDKASENETIATGKLTGVWDKQ